MIPDPLSDTGHPQAEVIAGTSPGGTTGIVITPGERVADPWAEGRHPPAIGPWKLAARRLRRNYVAQAFLVLFLLIVVACLLAPFYASHIAHIGPNTNNVTGTINIGGKTTDVVSTDGVPIGPTFSSRYFFGADSNGRDLAVRLLYGGRTSLLIGGIGTVIIIAFGTLVGLLTGYIRGEVLRLREMDFVEAARVQGMGSWRIMLSEILPNLASMITVFVPMMLAYAILLEAYLSFLGAGVQAPN